MSTLILLYVSIEIYNKFDFHRSWDHSEFIFTTTRTSNGLIVLQRAWISRFSDSTNDIYLRYSCGCKSFAYLYLCAKFAHTVEYRQIFGVPHRLIDPLYQSPPNRDISHDQSPGNFRCLGFCSFFFSPFLSALAYPLRVSGRLTVFQLEYKTWPILATGIGRQPATEELNRIRVHTSCKCTPFQPLMPMTCSLIGTKS